jgi:hypothetical protein
MVASAMGVDAVRLAFYLGVPAPHRKVTAQVLIPFRAIDVTMFVPPQPTKSIR